MRYPSRFILAIEVTAVSLVPLPVASRTDDAQPSLPPARVVPGGGGAYPSVGA
jgi:hypothetical protein